MGLLGPVDSLFQNEKGDEDCEYGGGGGFPICRDRRDEEPAGQHTMPVSV